jgi:hypothetical protein
MTRLGISLVISNLIFALVTASLIVMVYATRTNWKRGYDEVSGQLRVAHANFTAAQQRMADLKNQQDKHNQELTTQLAKAKEENELLSQEKEKLKKLHEESQSLAAKNGESLNIATLELDRRRQEVKVLQELLAQKEKDMAVLAGEAKKMRDRAIKAEIDFQSASDRNANLLVTVEGLVKEVERLKGKGPLPGVQLGTFVKNPPPEDVRGVVKQTDTQSGLMTISIGSDAGLSRGNTLEVYRLRPQPLYLGTMQIMDVRHNEAIGKLITGTQRRGPVQPGDEVASNILGKN